MQFHIKHPQLCQCLEKLNFFVPNNINSTKKLLKIIENDHRFDFFLSVTMFKHSVIVNLIPVDTFSMFMNPKRTINILALY